MAGGGKKINEPTDADNAAQNFTKKSYILNSDKYIYMNI